MARMRRVNARKVYVTYGSWCVQDGHESAEPLYPDQGGGRPGDVAYGAGFLTEYTGRFDVASAGHTHTAAVTVEQWDGAPPPDTRRRWDERSEVTFASASGVAAFWSDGRDAEVQLLTPGTWRVRAYCAGREAVARLSREVGPVLDVEVYLLQFWPAAAGTTQPE
ncbi:hypothetical protein [Streptomyces niger]|uniref:hypothetical protein n=1 Tax=Streptomyces niger TaxID=66373 RepID=UPI000AAC6DE8|nr:hypothetical protein [Streptomyces niger]